MLDDEIRELRAEFRRLYRQEAQDLQSILGATRSSPTVSTAHWFLVWICAEARRRNHAEVLIKTFTMRGLDPNG